nr:MAG TPA: hypothetical protein [Caudoviricetes sp.]
MRGFCILCQSPPFRILFCFATTPHFRLKRAAISQRCRGPFFVSLLSVAVHIWYELCLTLRTFLTN